MFSKCKTAAVCAALGAGSLVQAIFLDANNEQSVKDVAAQIAGDLMRNYYINAPIQGVGQLPRPYYWWEAGATFGSLVAYHAYTGDDSLNDVVGKAILSQLSSTTDFMMLEQKGNLGNDDQVVWALTAMEAAEHNYPIPSSLAGQYGSDIWITAAKNAFKDIAGRWDTQNCGGGVRWQIFPENSGYTYKSAISNAGLFQLAARLARYTGDSDGQYQAMATKIYNWLTGVGIVIQNGDNGKMVFDGAKVDDNCTTPDQHRWSYNAASMYLGAEMLADLNKNNAQTWGPIATDLFHGIQNTFLNWDSAPGIFFELICEPYGTCNTDQLAFKALMLRWVNKIRVVSPATYTNALIEHYTKSSALAAAGICAGGNSGTMCGDKWIVFGWDGTQGVGQQISALEAVQGLLVTKAPLATASGGGSSKSKTRRDTTLGIRGLSARDYMEMSDAARRAM